MPCWRFNHKLVSLFEFNMLSKMREIYLMIWIYIYELDVKYYYREQKVENICNKLKHYTEKVFISKILCQVDNRQVDDWFIITTIDMLF